VNHVLLRSGAFVRAARKFVKKNPQLASGIEASLRHLQLDPHHPSLKTHKLKGELAESWACSAGYDLRIVFQFVRHQGQAAILLQTLGTHDEVY
jgi:mRNA-degrading endonuclease YafQ of YafQ-DinJ toxin-antitoxin module